MPEYEKWENVLANFHRREKYMIYLGKLMAGIFFEVKFILSILEEKFAGKMKIRD